MKLKRKSRIDGLMKMKKAKLNFLIFHWHRKFLFIFIFTSISVFHATSSFTESGYKHYLVFRSNDLENKISLILSDDLASTNPFNRLYSSIGNKWLVQEFFESHSLAQRLSDDLKITLYFFPNNIDDETGLWISSSSTTTDKIKKYIKELLTGRSNNLSPEELMTTHLVGILNSKVKLNYHSINKTYNLEISGLNLEFARYFADRLLTELNFYFDERTNSLLSNEIGAVEVLLKSQKKSTKSKYWFRNELVDLKFAKELVSEQPFTFFGKLYTITSVIPPKMSLVSYVFFGILRGVVFSIIFILFMYRYTFMYKGKVMNVI